MSFLPFQCAAILAGEPATPGHGQTYTPYMRKTLASCLLLVLCASLTVAPALRRLHHLLPARGRAGLRQELRLERRRRPPGRQQARRGKDGHAVCRTAA